MFATGLDLGSPGRSSQIAGLLLSYLNTTQLAGEYTRIERPLSIRSVEFSSECAPPNPSATTLATPSAPTVAIPTPSAPTLATPAPQHSHLQLRPHRYPQPKLQPSVSLSQGKPLPQLPLQPPPQPPLQPHQHCTHYPRIHTGNRTSTPPTLTRKHPADSNSIIPTFRRRRVRGSRGRTVYSGTPLRLVLGPRRTG